jgi:hypothetical protein
VADPLIEAENPFDKSKMGGGSGKSFLSERNRTFLFECARWSWLYFSYTLLGALAQTEMLRRISHLSFISSTYSHFDSN